MLICLHGYSLVVVVISSCFGMKLQSKYASVRLLEQLSVVHEREESFLQNMSDSFFFFFRYRCLEISFRLQDVFGMLWCVGISLLMSSSWLNTLTNQQSYFPDERLQCHKQKNQSNCRSFFLLFVVISQMNFFFFFFWNAVVEECSTTKNSAACFHYKLDPLTVRANWRHVCIILIFLSER